MTPKRPAKKIKAKPKAPSLPVDYYVQLNRIAADIDALRVYVTNNVPTMSQVRELEKLIGYQRAIIDRLMREREELNAKVNAPPDRFWNWEQAGELYMSNEEVAEAVNKLRLADDTPNPLHDIERREAMRKGIDEACK